MECTKNSRQSGIWNPARWHVRSGRALGTKEDAKTINLMLDTIALKAREARRILIDENKEITAQAIKNYLIGIDDVRLFSRFSMNIMFKLGTRLQRRLH
jgi:hypothetical protein